MKILNMVIPILMHFLTFIRQRHSILHQTDAFWQSIAEYTVANFWRHPIRLCIVVASMLELFILTI